MELYEVSVKRFSTGFICTCLLISASAVAMRAQERRPAEERPPAAAEAAPDPQAAPPQQTPTTQTPPQTPPAPTPPAQTPAPADTQAPPGRSVLIKQPPPPPPKLPDVRMPGEMGWFVGVSGWFPTELPSFDKGRASLFTNSSKLQFQGKPKIARGGEIGIAAGAHNTLRIAYFDSRAAGDFTTTRDTTALDQTYVAGTLVATNYRVQNAKISFEYLTWPYPVESRRFRLKTLWQIQYVSFRAGFDAPLLPTTDSSGNLLTDANGNPVSFAALQSKWFISPAFGLGVAQYASKYFRLEANASGFTIPRHTTIWDVDASANIRFSHFELRVGGKAFHFKTSTSQDFYTHNIMGSAFAGVRWYSK